MPEANLFLRHGSLGASHFEQYTIQKNFIFIECGEIQGDRKIIEADELYSLEGKDLTRLGFLLSQVSITTAKLSPKNITEATKDPSILQLTIMDVKKSREITTSLSAITEGASSLETVLLEIAERIRGLNHKILCGNNNFYGIEKINE